MAINYSILNHSYDIIDKDIFKNCKSKLLLGDHELIIEELLKKFNFNKETKSNNNFVTLLRSLSVIGMKIYEDNISCNRSNIGVLICTTNLSNIINIKKISNNNNPDSLLLENNNIEKNLVCKMKTQLNFDITEQSITYYKRKYNELRNMMSNSTENRNNKFLYNGKEYLITFSNNDRAQTNPTRMEMLVEIENFYNKNPINIDKTLDLFYNLINEMIFYYLPENFFTHFNNFRKDDVDFFKKIKDNITNYVNYLFFFIFKDKKLAASLFNNYNLKINISINNNNITYIYFYLFNKLNQTLYIPYYNIYNSIDINDLIFCLENEINYLDSFYNFMNETSAFKDELDCKKIYSGVKDWTEKDFTAKPINNTNEYINLLNMQNKIDEIKILSYYPSFNKQHENCTIAVNIELENKYYYISIMSITMQEFNKIGTIGNVNKFKEDYINNLKKIINDNPEIRLNDSKIINTSLPSILKVMIKQLDNKPEQINNLYIKETAQDYYNLVLPKMKVSIINPNLILLHLWLSEYRKILIKFPYLDKLFFIEKYVPTLNKEIKDFIELTKNFMKIDDVCFVILTVIDFTDNFVMIYKISNITELISFYHKKKYMNLDINRQELVNKINYLACNILDFENYIKINKDELDILLNELFNDIITDEKFYLFISKYIRATQFSYLVWYVPNNLSIEDNNSKFEKNERYEKLEGCEKKLIFKLLDILTENLKNNIYKKQDFKIKDIILGHLSIKLKKFSGEDELIFSKTKIINMISNFYKLYTEDNFSYNIRHFNNNLYKEMKDLLIKTQKYNYLIFCHYPNEDRLNILHWHIYTDYFETDDIIGKKIDTSYNRAIFFDKINNDNNIYEKKDIIISMPVKIKGDHMTVEDIEEAEQYKKKLRLSRKEVALNNIILSDKERSVIDPLISKIKEKDGLQNGGRNYYKLYNKYKNKYINLKNNYNLQ
jgi:hypothetical protein